MKLIHFSFNLIPWYISAIESNSETVSVQIIWISTCSHIFFNLSTPNRSAVCRQEIIFTFHVKGNEWALHVYVYVWRNSSKKHKINEEEKKKEKNTYSALIIQHFHFPYFFLPEIVLWRLRKRRPLDRNKCTPIIVGKKRTLHPKLQSERIK